MIVNDRTLVDRMEAPKYKHQKKIGGGVVAATTLGDTLVELQTRSNPSRHIVHLIDHHSLFSYLNLKI